MARWQYAAALLLLVVLLAWPPRQGALLLVPIGAAARARLVPLALANGGRLLARGPFGGSIIVEGARDRIAPALAKMGIVTLAAPPAACGEDGIRDV